MRDFERVRLIKDRKVVEAVVIGWAGAQVKVEIDGAVFRTHPNHLMKTGEAMSLYGAKLWGDEEVKKDKG